MKGPRHLWTGDWRSDSRRNAEELDTHEPLTRHAENGGAPEDERPSAEPRDRAPARRPFTIAALVCAGAIALAAGFLVAGGGGGHHKAATTAKPASPLAAVPDKPLTPRKGQTRANAVYQAVSPAVVSVNATSTRSSTG